MRFARDIGIAHENRKLDRIHEAAQHLGAIIEFVVAHGHPVIAKLVHHLGGQLALVVRVEQRPLKLVSTIDEDRIVRPRARFLDRGDKARGAAKTLAFAVVLGGTAAVILADRFKSGVEIVGVQNGQAVVGLRHARA